MRNLFTITFTFIFVLTSCQTERGTKAASTDIKAIQVTKEDSTIVDIAPVAMQSIQAEAAIVWSDSLPIVRGQFSYMADAALFFPCGEGKGYPVQMRNDFISAERAYLKTMGEEAGQRAFITVQGQFSGEQQPDQAGRRSTLTIDQFISITREVDCNMEATTLTGTYTPTSDNNGTLKVEDSDEAMPIRWAMPCDIAAPTLVKIEGFVIDDDNPYFLTTRLIGVRG